MAMMSPRFQLVTLLGFQANHTPKWSLVAIYMYLVHGVCVLHSFVVPLQQSGSGFVLSGGVSGGGLVPEGQGIDRVGRVERLQRHLNKNKKRKQRKNKKRREVSYQFITFAKAETYKESKVTFFFVFAKAERKKGEHFFYRC